MMWLVLLFKCLNTNDVTGAAEMRSAELLKCGVRNSDRGIQFAAAGGYILQRKLLIGNDVAGAVEIRSAECGMRSSVNT
jgi:hypothetical protein